MSCSQPSGVWPDGTQSDDASLDIDKLWGYGPENITRLRRFAVGLIKSKGVRSVAEKMRELTWNVRLVFDYLKMTKNSCAGAKG